MVVVEKTKRRRQSHINQAYQRAMEMPINRYLCESVGIVMQQMHQSYKCMKAQQKKLSGCASNSLAHEDLGHFEEAHHWNIQAKFYNVKFHQYMKVTKQETLYHEDHGATLKHKCGKRIVALSLLSFSLIFFIWAFSLFLWPLFLVRSLIPTCWGIIVSIILSSHGTML